MSPALVKAQVVVKEVDSLLSTKLFLRNSNFASYVAWLSNKSSIDVMSKRIKDVHQALRVPLVLA